MGDTLFGSLMGKLPSHLYIIAGFLESVLKGHHVYHVASPGVDAHQLVGILKWFVPGHTRSLSVVATKDDTLGQIQDSHWQIDSQCWLESLLTDLHTWGLRAHLSLVVKIWTRRLYFPHWHTPSAMEAVVCELAVSDWAALAGAVYHTARCSQER